MRRSWSLRCAVALTAILPASYGCSVILAKGPPQQHDRMGFFSCTESKTAPGVDVGLGIVYAIIAFTPDTMTGKVEPGMTAVGLGLATAFGFSAANGFKKVRQCREAKQQLAMRMVGAPSVASVPVAAPAARAAPVSSGLPDVRQFSPRQLNPRGAREVSIALPVGVTLGSVEVTPPEGVSVTGIHRGSLDGDERRWRATASVDSGVPAGERSLVLVTSRGRSAPIIVTIPPHAPRIMGVNLLSVEESPVSITARAVVRDEKDDLGASPRVVSALRCGTDVHVSVAAVSEVANVGVHLYRVTFALSGGPTGRVASDGSCTLSISISDREKYEGDLEQPIVVKPTGM